MIGTKVPAILSARSRLNVFDLIALFCILGVAITCGTALRHMLAPLPPPNAEIIHLDPSYLPAYAGRTVLRMFAAMGFSLLFTFTYAVWAAKSRRAALVLVPILDILQSVPILGFLTFTVVFFMGLFPGKVMGAELAAIFTIFTSQAWNMAFSLYQSLKTIPSDLEEVSRSFRLSSWQKFWRLEIPFAMPGLIWNMMVSMSGGWFMIVYSESISVGETQIMLPGIGSYVGVAIDQRNVMGVIYAIIAMFLVILAYDQILFRPLVRWAEHFRMETVQREHSPDPWMLGLWHRVHLLRKFGDMCGDVLSRIGNLPLGARPGIQRAASAASSRMIDRLWVGLVLCVAAFGFWETILYVRHNLGFAEVWHVVFLGAITFVRVMSMIILTSLIWFPVGIWLGLRPAWASRAQLIAQFMAAFPANLLFPVFVVGIVHFHLNSDIWLTPLMVLGTQWYILFNVISGAANFPADLLEVAKNFHIRRWVWWSKIMIPGVFAHYVTGAITASGGAWNAAIAAEMASWGSTTLTAKGLGSYIAQATISGSTAHVGLGMVIMSAYVLICNRLVWRPMYDFAQRRLMIS